MHIELPSPSPPYPHPSPFSNDIVICRNIHHHYQEEEDGHLELPPPPYPHPPPFNNDNVIGTNQCLCLPKAELNTKNSIKRQLCCLLIEFLVFNSIH